MNFIGLIASLDTIKECLLDAARDPVIGIVGGFYRVAVRDLVAKERSGRGIEIHFYRHAFWRSENQDVRGFSVDRRGSA